MAKKNIVDSENVTPKLKAYSYDASLEGATIGAHKQLTISASTPQKDLKILFERGVKGIVKND